MLRVDEIGRGDQGPLPDPEDAAPLLLQPSGYVDLRMFSGLCNRAMAKYGGPNAEYEAWVTRQRAAIEAHQEQSGVSVPPGPGPCELCGGRGRIQSGGSAVICDCIRAKLEPGELGERDTEAAITSTLLHSGVPKRAVRERWTFESYENRLGTRGSRADAVEYGRLFSGNLEQFRAMFGKMGLLLDGPFGTGKTGIACAAARELVASGKLVRFVKWASMLDELKASFDIDGASAEIVRRYSEAPILILDDLGDAQWEGKNDWRRDVARQVVDRRYDMAAPTIVTSNLDEPQLEEQIGGAMVSRLHELCHWVWLSGEDVRRAA